MKPLHIYIALISFLVISCNSASHTKQADSTAAQHDNASHDKAHAEHSTAVTLNKGQKWEANAETTEGIKKMTSLVEEFAKEPTAEDYQLLKTDLEKEFNTILQKCTMTGEAHNQLHNYLLPMKDMMKNLGSDAAEEQEEALNSLKAHLQEYGTYFQ